jgi:hypothetical protein
MIFNKNILRIQISKVRNNVIVKSIVLPFQTMYIIDCLGLKGSDQGLGANDVEDKDE